MKKKGRENKVEESGGCYIWAGRRGELATQGSERRADQAEGIAGADIQEWGCA